MYVILQTVIFLWKIKDLLANHIATKNKSINRIVLLLLNLFWSNKSSFLPIKVTIKKLIKKSNVFPMENLFLV